MDFVLNPADKFYPEANNWMWNYCTFLGKFTDSTGTNFDLGIHITSIEHEVLDATVHSDKPGDYTSGSFENIEDDTREWKLECYKRAKVLNLIY